jgi:hypothetical protein
VIEEDHEYLVGVIIVSPVERDRSGSVRITTLLKILYLIAGAVGEASAFHVDGFLSSFL